MTLQVAEDPVTPYRILPFITAKELATRTPEKPDHLVEGYLVMLAITEFVAKIKAGKTTFTLAMIYAFLHEQMFLDREPGIRSPVIYLTEERPSTFRAALERANLLDEEDLHILHRADVSTMEWEELVRLTYMTAKSKQAKLVVIDTLARWAKLPADSENESGAAGSAMEPLELVCNAGLSILTIRHDKRGDAGELGDWGRGSSGFGGTADIMLNLQRANQNGHPNRRRLQAITRYDNLPEEQFIDLDAGHYEVVGEGERESGKGTLLNCLVMGGAQDLATLILLTGLARTTAQRALDELVAAGSVSKAGGGRGRGNSAIYTAAP